MDTKGPKLSILIADDDAVTRGALRLLLTEQGHSVIGEAVDGARALDMCMLLKPDIIFSDINMPKLDGLDLSDQIRTRAPKVRIVIISSLPTVANVRRAMQGGASGFVVKPFNARNVIDALNNCVRQEQTAAAKPA
ncbi:MAG: response regulator [Pseudomonadota bacterium]